MNLSSPAQVRALLDQLEFNPSRALGQNFLIDGNTLRIMVDLVGPSADETILEIGPGLGVLTAPLLEKAGRVIAVEKDPRLHRYLEKHMWDKANFELIEGDILEVLDERPLFAEAEKIAANLPYSISGRFLVELSLADITPAQAVLTVQDEVAERLAAVPGKKSFGALSVFVQSRYNVTVNRTVSPGCFYPRPQVKSAIVVLEQTQKDPLEGAVKSTFQELVRYAFSQRRKQLGTSLARAPQGIRVDKETLAAWLQEWGYSNKSRPEEIPAYRWQELAERISSR